MKFAKKYLVYSSIALLVIAGITFGGCSNNNAAEIENNNQTESQMPKINFEDYETISIVNNENIDKGKLILINNTTLYNKQTYEENKKNLKSMDKLKSSSYGVYYNGLILDEEAILALNNMSDAAKEDGIDNYVISSAFRTAETQKQFLDREIAQLGEELGKKYVALPYGSEHQTGLAIDYRLLQPNGEKIRLKENHSEFEWLKDNCYKYGYILRYQEDKQDITAIAYEPWHFRYVGIPHATIMKQENLALEEYIEYLTDYKFGENHLEKTIDDKTYEIYYIEQSEGEVTDISVPKDKKYTLSGNNVDGFIVTVEM